MLLYSIYSTHAQPVLSISRFLKKKSSRMTNWISLSYSVMHLVLHNALTKQSATTDYFLLKVTCPFVCFFSLCSPTDVSHLSVISQGGKVPAFASFVLLFCATSHTVHADTQVWKTGPLWCHNLALTFLLYFIYWLQPAWCLEPPPTCGGSNKSPVSARGTQTQLIWQDPESRCSQPLGLWNQFEINLRLMMQ